MLENLGPFRYLGPLEIRFPLKDSRLSDSLEYAGQA